MGRAGPGRARHCPVRLTEPLPGLSPEAVLAQQHQVPVPLPGVRHVPLQLPGPAGPQQPPQLLPQPLGRRAPAGGPGGDRVLRQGRAKGWAPPPPPGLGAGLLCSPGSRAARTAPPRASRAGRACPAAPARPRGPPAPAAARSARPGAAPVPDTACTARRAQPSQPQSLRLPGWPGTVPPERHRAAIPTAPHLRRWANLGSVASAGTAVGTAVVTAMGTSVPSILPGPGRC